MSFVQFVTITAKSGKRDEILDYLSKVKTDVGKNEPGTTKYHIAKSTEDENIIYLWEQYDDKSAHTAHGQGEPYKTFKSAAGGLVESLKIIVCDPLPE